MPWHAGKGRFRHVPAVFGIAAGAALILLFLSTTAFPGLGATGADWLRSLLGDHAVAHLEDFAFRAGDRLQSLAYRLGFTRPDTPWQSPPATPAPISLAIRSQQSISPSAIPSPSAHSSITIPQSPTLSPSPYPQSLINNHQSAIPSPSLTAWLPPAIEPIGNLPGEGIWTPYLFNPGGETVAFRSFVQPDPDRPYAYVAVVAFDLSKIRLAYVLGSDEPDAPGVPPRTGAIPAEEKLPGKLLATFNGGFKTTHGHFGAKAGGIQVLPPRDGLGTLAIYPDGSVQMGVLGEDIALTGEETAWRQNGPLVIHNREVHPDIYNNSPKDWGYTVDDVSPTLRSGIGLDAWGQTLYYFCGPRLTMESLAVSMLAAGATNGMQLDINNFWTHFVAIRVQDGKLAPEPLLPDLMTGFLDRYLHPYSRDYFYVTALNP